MKNIHSTKQSRLVELHGKDYYDFSEVAANISYGPLWYAVDNEFGDERVDEEVATMIPWDCFCGFGVFGNKASIDAAKSQLLDYLKSNLDANADIQDMRDEDSGFHSMFEFSVNGTDASGLICSGYYEEIDQNLIDLLKAMPNVFVTYAGANYGLVYEVDPLTELRGWLSDRYDEGIQTPEGVIHVNDLRNADNIRISKDIAEKTQPGSPGLSPNMP